MSKIGKLPIATSGVTVQVNGQEVHVSGAKGSMTFTLPSLLKVTVEGETCNVTVAKKHPQARPLQGLYRTLINNAVQGATTEWSKTLEVQGTGFRANMEGTNLIVRVGYSHPVTFPTPQGTTISVKGNKITVSGMDKQRVGEIASLIRAIRAPDRYKGKGIRYSGEVIRLKPGKKAKAA